MHKLGHLFIGVIVAGSTMLTSNAHSQDRIPREVREKIASALGVDPYSQKIDDLIFKSSPNRPKVTEEQKRNILAATIGVAPNNPTLQNVLSEGRELPPLADIKVVKHYQFSEGKEINKVTLKVSNSSTEINSKITQELVLARSMELAKRTEQAMKTPKKLPRCSSARTEQKKYEGLESNDVALDILIMDRRPPVEADEIFGKGTTIIRYSTATGDVQSAAIGGAGVECLPYRVRMVGNTRYTYWGENALRNFDKNPHGAGQLSKLLKSKISEYR